MFESKAGVLLLGGLGFFVFAFISNALVPVYMFKDLPEEDYPYVHDIVRRVSETFNLKPAALKLDESPDINAYTTSVFGSSSVLVITKGLLDRVESEAFTEDQLHAIVSGIVQSADKRANIGGPGQSAEECLVK